MENYKTKAKKFTEVFRLMDGFKTRGIYYLSSTGDSVYDCFTNKEKELYDLLWNENFEINRERLNYSFSKGNDEKYNKLIEEAFNLLEKSFKEYIADSKGNISLCNRVEYLLEEKLKEIQQLKEEFNQLPEYSNEFSNIGIDIEIPGVGIVQKIKPTLNENGYISNSTGCLDFDLKSSIALEEGLYIFPKLNNLRFDIIKSCSYNDFLTLSINLDTEDEKAFLGLMENYIDDYESQMKEYCISNEDIRYSVYDVYSVKELL